MHKNRTLSENKMLNKLKTTFSGLFILSVSANKINEHTYFMFMVLACLILQLDNVLLSNQIITHISTRLWIYRFWDLLKFAKKYILKACLKKI